ncbi:MAG: winged helix-turn-helix transcriptional regulator [Candidatus Omnitrophica bacterium]|nr:winged helix-turn-helix transcriptional regulator [Candidatus Omnitrophota bacterium]
MDKKEHITSSEKSLLFLKTIEQSPQITQRDLSQKLGLSLGKINFLVNALVDKGIIKTRNFTNSNNK